MQIIDTAYTVDWTHPTKFTIIKLYSKLLETRKKLLELLAFLGKQKGLTELPATLVATLNSLEPTSVPF